MGLKKYKKIKVSELDEIYNRIYGLTNVIYIESIMLSESGFEEVAEDVRFQIYELFYKIESSSAGNRICSGLKNLTIILRSMFDSLEKKKINMKDYLRIKQHVIKLAKLIRELNTYNLNQPTICTKNRYYNPV